MSYNSEKEKAMGDLRDYMESKYGTAYMSAISKLSKPNQFDKNGLLRPEVALTSKEKDALLFYVPETSKFLNNVDTIEPIQNINKFESLKPIQNINEVKRPNSKSLDERYQDLLDDVRKETIKSASNQTLPSNPNAVIPWKVVGIEFASWEIEKKYGKDVYAKACEEVPYEKVPNGRGGFLRMFNRDFSNASRRLGHIIHEGVAASPLMDLDLFVKELEKQGIPSYIDFETNTFYYNGVPTKGKTK